MIRWLIWALYVVGWTYLLVFPVPPAIHQTVEDFAPGRRDYFAKALHVAAYGLMTVLSAWLKSPIRYRFLLIVFLMAHATVTELVQLTLSYRSGNLIDVAFDHLGVLLGVAVSWPWWVAKDPP